jgi:hypothetical protein
MSVLGRVLFSSAQRVDLQDLLSIDSYVASDFKYLIQSIAGDGVPYILKGFDVISPADAIGTQNVSIRVADSVVFFPMSTVGAFYYGLPNGFESSAPLIPDLKKNATNYIYLTFDTFDTAQDTRAFWDPDKESGAGGEFTQDVNTESVLKVNVNVSTAAFPVDTIPICKVVVGTTVIQSIQDCRQMLFRLGTGGTAPNPAASYEFDPLPSAAYARQEVPGKIISNSGLNPFQGSDKNIRSFKEWMDAVMTKIKEIGGTTFWYEDASSYNAATLFSDIAARSIKSKGKWEHDFAVEGKLTWTETIELQSTNDARNIMLRSGTRTLGNNQVLYINSIRNKVINTSNTPVIWLMGTNYINGDTGYFENLSRGDWIKPQSASNSYYYRVIDFYNDVSLGGGGGATAANAKSILIDGISVFDDELVTTYTKGVYTASEMQVSDRSDPALSLLGGNFYWLAMRTDTINKIASVTSGSVAGNVTVADGASARIECAVAHNLIDGDYITISAGLYAGTYRVEVETTDTFYIQTSVTALVGINGYYATVSTTNKTDPGTGFLLESQNHGFESGQAIKISGTTSFDGVYNINVRSATTFTIPMPSLPASESPVAGFATLNRISIRTESGVGQVIRGENRIIGSPETEALMSFVGMSTPNQPAPLYVVPSNYNAKDGKSNYNADEDDSLTVRAAKLTAMMADKAQDKQMSFIGHNIDTVTNTVYGSAQQLTFSGGGPKLMIHMSESPGGYVGLSGILPLEDGQAAYFTVDRNEPFEFLDLTDLTVTSIESVPLDENIFIFALRDNGQSVYLWDGHRVGIGEYPFYQSVTTELRVRSGVASEDTYEDYFSTGTVAELDSYPAAISKLDSALTNLTEATAIEESQVVGAGGTTVFNATSIIWDPLNTSWDILVFVNGVKQRQDTGGGLVYDYYKTSSTSLAFSYTVPEYADITVRVERPELVPIPSEFFRFDSTGYGGVAAFTAYNYDTGTEQLQVFRNGIGLIHSTTMGIPVDRYTEASANTVNLGAACPTSETLYFVNLPAPPDYRDFIDGQVGTTITIPTYSGLSRLMVFRNGLLMNKSGLGDSEDSYTEFTPTSIELTSAAISSEVFTFIHLASAPLNRAETSTVVGATINVGFNYTNGTGKLLVFRNGVLLNSNSLGALVDQYAEVGAPASTQSTIVLQQAATLGEVFTFILLG